MIGRIHSFLKQNWQQLGFDSPDMRGMRLAIINGGVSVRSKLVWLCWKPGAQTPFLVIKVPRYSRYNPRLEAEYATLQRLHEYLPQDDQCAPKPLASSEIDGMRVTVESASKGRLLRAYLREHPEEYSQELSRMKPFADWLAMLHARSAEAATPQQLEEFVFAPLAAAEIEFYLSGVERAGLGRLRDAARRLCASNQLPIVFNHNDCGTTNILVDEQGRLSSVIDWEGGGLGLPCLDLMDFLGRFAYETRAAGGADPLKGFREIFFLDSVSARARNEAHSYRAGRSPQPLEPSIAVRWLNDYCRQIGLATEWLPVLFGLCWIMHARKEKSDLIGLREEGQVLHGMPRTVSSTTTDDSILDKGHFRSQLRYYLENLDSFAAADGARASAPDGLDILVLTPFMPYPQAHSGCPRAVFDRINLLAREHRVTVATFARPGEEKHAIELEQQGVRVHWTHYDPEAGLSGWRQWRKRARLLAGLVANERPMLVTEFHSARQIALVSKLLTTQDFDVIMIEHILMAQYLDGLGLDNLPPIVLTEHDVRLAVPDSQVSESSPLKRQLVALDRSRWLRYEMRACRNASVVTVPTAEDARVLERLVSGLRPVLVPFGMSALPLDGPPSDVERESDTLLFVGNYHHPPNVDAAIWLCREILPLVRRQRPSVKLWLVGWDPTPEVWALSGERVDVVGGVPSIEPYLRRCTLFVAPMRMGGGMRMKLIEALSMGAPVVTTSLGAHGLGVEDRKHLLLADDAPGLASAILKALTDAELRARLSLAGRAWAISKDRTEERARQLNVLLDEVRRKTAEV